MGRPKGYGKTGGRQPNTVNRVSFSVKQSVWEAFLKMQEDPDCNIISWGKKNLKDFYLIAAKLIPAEVTGANGKDLVPEVSLNSYTTEELIARAVAIKNITSDKG